MSLTEKPYTQVFSLLKMTRGDYWLTHRIELKSPFEIEPVETGKNDESRLNLNKSEFTLVRVSLVNLLDA